MCATLGVVLPSFVIILFVARFYQKFKSSELVIGGRLTFLPGASVEGADGLFDLPDAPIGDGVAQLPALPDSDATTVAALREDFNHLLSVLRRADILAAPPDEGGDG